MPDTAEWHPFTVILVGLRLAADAAGEFTGTPLRSP